MDPARQTAQESDRQRIVRTFFKNSCLVQIPVKRKKRRVVLAHLAENFDAGQRYTEPEVNAILAAFHPDVASLRRHLVDEDFLDRENGVYWLTERQ
ncbi:MAG: DUF2087 domain-containing protein [Nocardioides sp.]